MHVEVKYSEHSAAVLIKQKTKQMSLVLFRHHERLFYIILYIILFLI